MTTSVSEILMFQIFYIENLGQGHGVYIQKISTSIKPFLRFFRKLSPFSRYSHFKTRDLENVGQSRDVQDSQ